MVFSAIRRRMHVSPATVIASLALVFAMTGGAYAAKKYLITSTKQISPSVLKSLQGKTGPVGAAGAAGAQGAQGLAGPAGAKGEPGAAGVNGDRGADGTSVTSIEFAGKREKCSAGGSEFKVGGATTYACSGKNGTFGDEPLPAGKTLTGTYAAASYSAAKFGENGFGQVQAAASFALPYAGEPHAVYVNGTPTTECPGTANEPKAKEGFLCIYSEAEANLAGEPSISNKGTKEASVGFSLNAYAAAAGRLSMEGTWAVTGE